MIETFIKTGNTENLLHEIKELRRENTKLNEINKEIFDGFTYAATIQQGLLPQQRHLDRLFNEYFVIYEPQNIISGDFFWTAKKNDITYFAVADCTGHGISGAMLSVLGISYLNYVVLGKDHSSLGDMLSEVDRKWIETFNIYGDRSRDNDWMEISICSFDHKKRELKFAGANGKVFIVNETESNIINGDHYPIGGWQIEKDRKYTEHTIAVPEYSMVYLSSDGFKDQLGGMHNKTFKQKRMREFLSDIFYLPPGIQKSFLKVAFNEWKGNNKQTDDVCVLGVRL
ncbi:MAG TPA: SpoIIE family protein phosphatase [Bacteroidia bacterium]|jgi:serine phosphatase RsbU (regulator of sigma subunit)|nr:SpoIIE family protein phosphatase [Bacteroidia bacterium]